MDRQRVLARISDQESIKSSIYEELGTLGLLLYLRMARVHREQPLFNCDLVASGGGSPKTKYTLLSNLTMQMLQTLSKLGDKTACAADRKARANLRQILPSLSEIAFMVNNLAKSAKSENSFKDAILYKLVLDFYYNLNIKRGNWKVLLEKVVASSLVFYRSLSKPVFNQVISSLCLIRQERKAIL